MRAAQLRGVAPRPPAPPALLLALLALLAAGRGCGAWLRVDRACPPGCEARGNCNRELGVCECNIGWGGDSIVISDHPEHSPGAGDSTVIPDLLNTPLGAGDSTVIPDLLNTPLSAGDSTAIPDLLNTPLSAGDSTVISDHLNPPLGAGDSTVLPDHLNTPLGDSCDEPILGACRSSDSPTALVGYGKRWPKSCECWRQIQRWLWDQERREWRNARFAPDRHTIKYCYERDGVPPERQFSDVPAASEPSISFYLVHPFEEDRGKPYKNAPEDAADVTVFHRIENPGRIVTSDHMEEPLLPLSSCPDRCLDRGVCYQYGIGEAVWPGPTQGPWCMCRKGLMGPSCGEHDNWTMVPQGTRMGDKACSNNCSGNGECLAGFCKCADGYWGIDCSRSKAYAPNPAVPDEASGSGYNRTALRIYKYELPWRIAFAAEQNDGLGFYDYAYSTDDRFNEHFSGDWAVRTENPYEANLFYVPAMAVYMSNQERQDTHVRNVMAYINDTYPDLWARHQGRDHFLILPQDHGACYMDGDDPLNEAPIKVVHFGLQVSFDRYVDMPGKHERSHRRYGCFLPERDVAIPHADVKPGTQETSPEAHRRIAAETAAGTPPRQNLFFFGGSIRHHQKEYSGGARQALAKYVLERNDPRVKFGGAGVEEYWLASFCFNPYGDGYGNRLPHILLGGCVPVTVQEHVHQPFDDMIPYEEFGLVLKLADIPRLLEILEAIPQERILEYRRAAQKYYRAFYWSEDGEAYTYLLRSLFRRLQNLWAGVF